MTIAAKEFKSYLTSPMAYVVIAVFLLGTGFFFAIFPTSSAVTYASTSLSGLFGNVYYVVILLLLLALLTMRLLAEERKMGTIELLLTAPVRDSEIVVGKFLGGLGILVIMLVLTLYHPLLLRIFGDPDVGPMATAYLGLLLMGSAALAIGIFASSLTSNQIVAAVVAGGILLGLWFLGYISSALPTTLQNVVGYFSLSNYFPDFVKGVIDTRGVIYYLSVTVLFLFMAIRSLENSRWN